MTEQPIETVDRKSYEPAYAQLVRILRGQIAAGVFRPGDRLPSEAQLCERYAVSPMTVRRVINILVDQGVVYAEQGRGTFVKPLELGTAVFDLEQLQKLFRDDVHTTVKLLEARIVAATERTARKLQLEPRQRTIFLRRLISKDGVPMLLHREHLVGDIKRLYSLLICEWLDYMRHLKDHYPYLFSLAIRTNPFDEKASIAVK